MSIRNEMAEALQEINEITNIGVENHLLIIAMRFGINFNIIKPKTDGIKPKKNKKTSFSSSGA